MLFSMSRCYLLVCLALMTYHHDCVHYVFEGKIALLYIQWAHFPTLVFIVSCLSSSVLTDATDS